MEMKKIDAKETKRQRNKIDMIYLTSAPPSSVHSLVIGSKCTPAVKPTAEAPYGDK